MSTASAIVLFVFAACLFAGFGAFALVSAREREARAARLAAATLIRRRRFASHGVAR